ncbi:3-hydroxyacyl-CoA dehydrogenase [Paracoccus jiaweipingae]|uniref:3-hydroxyacyl-CoA dehydrogenase n=1 Tax=unclassified Paracoccus (in: a-proteobacteria) TaxID=2688777 RepID=UPI00378E2F72
MAIKTVAVLGTGVLGAQIAFQAAVHGFRVRACDLTEAGLQAAGRTIDWMAAGMQRDLGLAAGVLADARRGLVLTTDPEQALAGADLVIEAIPEDPDLKRGLYAQIAPLLAPGAINSSTLLPSALADAVPDPARFVALHFANEIWHHNLAEVMGHPGTDPGVITAVAGFARAIGMEAIVLDREQPGYVLNTLLVPFLMAAGGLVVDGVASPPDIDKVWRIATGAPVGPFQIYDIVGLRTAFRIASAGGPKSQEFARWLKAHYLDHGKTGRDSGQGFYRYDAG